MSSLIVKRNLDVTLPQELCNRYGIAPDTSLRVIETQNGILLVPLTSDPMDPELAAELKEWQSLSASSLPDFPYEES